MHTITQLSIVHHTLHEQLLIWHAHNQFQEVNTREHRNTLTSLMTISILYTK